MIDHSTALRFVITWLEANLAGRKVWAAGHRVVLAVLRRDCLYPARGKARILPASKQFVDRHAVWEFLPVYSDPII